MFLIKKLLLFILVLEIAFFKYFSYLKILLFILVLEIDFFLIFFLFKNTSIHFSFRNVIFYMFLI